MSEVKTVPVRFVIDANVVIVRIQDPAMGRTEWIGRTGVIEQVDDREGEFAYLLNVAGHGRVWVREDDVEHAYQNKET